MRFVSYYADQNVVPGVYVPGEEHVFSLADLYPSIREVFETCQNDFSSIARALEAGTLPLAGSLEELSLAPPVMPRKLLCVAGNYVDHIKEGGRELEDFHTQAPWVFTVPPSTVLTGHKQPIKLHPEYRKIDYEGELAIVIGRHAKGVRAEDAIDYIAGYTIFNDVSERAPYMTEHVEKPRDISFWYTKSFDTFGPLGPAIVTKDEIADPHDLTIRVVVNSEERQKCNTDLMIFKVGQLVEFLSSFMTLEPGDVIPTGTPSGVGLATGKYLHPGDRVQVFIDNIGALENKVE